MGDQFHPLNVILLLNILVCLPFLIVSLDRSYDTLTDVDFRIVDYGFNETTSNECKRLLREAIKRYYQPRNAVVDFEVDQILQLMIDRSSFCSFIDQFCMIPLLC